MPNAMFETQHSNNMVSCLYFTLDEHKYLSEGITLNKDKFPKEILCKHVNEHKNKINK